MAVSATVQNAACALRHAGHVQDRVQTTAPSVQMESICSMAAASPRTVMAFVKVRMDWWPTIIKGNVTVSCPSCAVV